MESTDKITGSNVDIPTIIRRYSFTITLTTITDYTWGSVTTDLSSDTALDWDIYALDNQDNVVYPLYFDTSYVVDPINAYVSDKEGVTYIDKDNDKIRINVGIVDLHGAVGDTYTIYVMVYSTKINEDLTL